MGNKRQGRVVIEKELEGRGAERRIQQEGECNTGKYEDVTRGKKNKETKMGRQKGRMSEGGGGRGKE